MSDPNYPRQGPYGGQQPPPYGQQPPPYGQRQPPPYGQPPYGQPPTPPGGQQPPPPYGQQLPPYGQQPPRYGQQPLPYREPEPPYREQEPPYREQEPPSYDDQPQYGDEQSEYPPPPQDYPPAPAAQPPKKRGLPTWLVIAVAAVVVLVAAFFVIRALNKSSAEKAEPGDCIKVKSANQDRAEIERIDCGDPGAVLKVAKKLGNDTDQCPTPDYEKYYQSGGASSDFALCLMLNAKEGECFTNTSDLSKLARADCAGAEIKIAKVVDKADETACDQSSRPLVFPEPPTTFCLAAP